MAFWHRARRLGLPKRHEEPLTADAAAAWPRVLAARLHDDQHKLLQRVLSSRPIIATSDDSGVGIFEIALTGIMTFFVHNGLSNIQGEHLKFHAASDISAECRRVLLAKTSVCKDGPDHVFGNIVAKYDEQVRSKLWALQGAAEAEVTLLMAQRPCVPRYTNRASSDSNALLDDPLRSRLGFDRDAGPLRSDIAQLQGRIGTRSQRSLASPC